ncbi:YusW family protein [Salsuginibacillus kocurii]|uniref:YusW family protein n=1 Tax=Salsuginibacillus kocurii TaxID=427078 RepID=UPI00037A3C87|nr:YusW family protein [Salsuginibacillus kocurii]
MKHTSLFFSLLVLSSSGCSPAENNKDALPSADTPQPETSLEEEHEQNHAIEEGEQDPSLENTSEGPSSVETSTNEEPEVRTSDFREETAFDLHSFHLHVKKADQADIVLTHEAHETPATILAEVEAPNQAESASPEKAEKVLTELVEEVPLTTEQSNEQLIQQLLDFFELEEHDLLQIEIDVHLLNGDSFTYSQTFGE